MLPEIEKNVKELVTKLKEKYQDQLISVCVYGSSVLRKKPVGKHNKNLDINVLVILDKLGLQELDKGTGVCKWWSKIGHSLPIFLSRQEWDRSNDVFALEYADIRDNHYVAYGEDLYSELEILPEALRLVCELELHRKLIFLREKYMQVEPKILNDLLFEGVGSFAALFRGVLRLKLDREEVPLEAAEVFENFSSLGISGFDSKPFLKVLEVKENELKLREDEILELTEQFIEQVGLVTDYVDQCFGFIKKREEVHS